MRPLTCLSLATVALLPRLALANTVLRRQLIPEQVRLRDQRLLGHPRAIEIQGLLAKYRTDSGTLSTQEGWRAGIGIGAIIGAVVAAPLSGGASLTLLSLGFKAASDGASFAGQGIALDRQVHAVTAELHTLHESALILKPELDALRQQLQPLREREDALLWDMNRCNGFGSPTTVRYLAPLHTELAQNLRSQRALWVGLRSMRQAHAELLDPIVAQLQQAVSGADELVQASTAELQQLVQTAVSDVQKL